MNTVCTGHENECFIYLKEMRTTKPYKKVNIIYLASVAFKPLQAHSVLITTISPVASPHSK